MSEGEKKFDSDSDIDPEELKQLYSQILAKNKTGEKTERVQPPKRSRSRSRDNKKRNTRGDDDEIQIRCQNTFKLQKYQPVYIDLKSIPNKIKHLPVFKKHQHILETILSNQIVLITGQTGCGKSTQIPRILYEYLLASKMEGRILCVQPRRLAAINLQKILCKQIPQQGVVSYHIAMENTIKPSTRILFMTNGIFLQRFIHDNQELLKQFPFIILDEVHERDIDTDFILLAVKHVVRKHPKIRIILMSATVDNGLFQYYFAEDHITKFMKEQNIYLKCLKAQHNDKRKRRNDRSDSEDSEKNRIQQSIAMDFMNSRSPCPSITITQPGAFVKKFYYLDDIQKLVQRPIQIQWANTSFNEKFPILMKQMITLGAQIVQDIFEKFKNKQTITILVFLPGLIQIQMFCNQVMEYCSKQLVFETIQLHSTTLNSDISSQLNQMNPSKHRLIVATNIAQSSITVMGVKYILDFCLSKEVRFNHKTRLENLQMVWSSKASSDQRAGRTGRVCDGYVIRLVQKQFYDKLPKYSTPQIQRCSLDRLILRIKLLHENELTQKSASPIFSDPGTVLGRAIQPPALKNIDASIKSLMFNGGLELINEQFHLTDLGRLYIDLPVDIIYSRMLILSMILGTFDDIIILVTLLQQAKNPFKKQGLQKKYMQYWQLIQNDQLCDFYGLVQLYKKKYINKQKISEGIDAYSYNQIKTHKIDIQKRLCKLKMYKNKPVYNSHHELRFKITIWAAFLDNAMRVVLPPHDQKQEKRIKGIAARNIPLDKTLVINSTLIKKHKMHENNQQFIKEWKDNIRVNFRINKDPSDIVLDYSYSYVIFNNDLSFKKILFCKSIQETYGTGSSQPTMKSQQQQYHDAQRNLNFSITPKASLNKMTKTLNALGDLELIQKGQVMDMYTNRKVIVDNFSINRVISLSCQSNSAYIVTNSKVQRTSGSYCRYTSMLPDQLGLYQILLLVFYPYLSLRPDDNCNYYDNIRLRKKTKIKIGFPLTNSDIQEANSIRRILKQFFCLETEKAPRYNNSSNLNDQRFYNHSIIQFWPKLHSLLNTKRQPIIDQQKWQKIFLSQIDYKYQTFNQQQSLNKEIQQSSSQYMADIEKSQLKKGFFSYQHLRPQEYQQHIAQYNLWKQKILKEVNDIRDFIWNTQTHISCNVCGVKIARLRDVGTINNVMRTFSPLSGMLKDAQFNEMDDEFCSMLMTFDLADFKVQSCVNGHILAIKIGNPQQYKLLQFSNINILYPDDSRQDVDFDKLDMRNYNTKANKALSNKRNMNKAITCRICSEQCCNFAEMEKHLKSWMHDEIVKEFKVSLML